MFYPVLSLYAASKVGIGSYYNAEGQSTAKGEEKLLKLSL